MSPSLDWEGARNRDARRARGEKKWTPATTQAPTDAQRDLIRRLAADLNVPPRIPRTRRQASARINTLLRQKP